VIVIGRRVLGIAVLLTASLAASSCGAAAPKVAKRPTAPTSAAQAYVRISRTGFRAYAVAARRAEAALNRRFNTCSVVQGRTASRQLPSEARFALLDRVAIAKAFYPSYLDFKNRLATVQTRDPALRSARAAVEALSRYYAPLLQAKPDYCRVLTEWKRVGWHRRFNIGRSVGASILLLAEPKRVGVARAAIKRARIRLRFAGVKEPDARLFFEIASLPGTTNA
jgi:hypothetical protein